MIMTGSREVVDLYPLFSMVESNLKKFPFEIEYFKK